MTRPLRAGELGGAEPRADAQAALETRALSVAYGEGPAVSEVDARFPAGAMTAILGPNGAGKSSFLKGALGLIPLAGGEARFFGAPLSAVRARVAYVPQRASVDWEFPARAIDVAMMGLYPRLGPFRLMGGPERARARACLDRVGMADLAERQIGRLSGGQQQRVFLARALAQGADLYLLDEPFAGVDAATERAIVGVLHGLRAEGRTVVCVHHDLTSVRDYFDRALVLNRVKVAEGPVGAAFTPATLQAAYGGRLAAIDLAAPGFFEPVVTAPDPRAAP
jgi:manganese/zinc/iron transport system ATP- binding protein